LEAPSAEFLGGGTLETASEDRDERDRNESDEVHLHGCSKMVFNRR
jgi:hypothetical protein